VHNILLLLSPRLYDIHIMCKGHYNDIPYGKQGEMESSDRNRCRFDDFKTQLMLLYIIVVKLIIIEFDRYNLIPRINRYTTTGKYKCLKQNKIRQI